MAFTPITLGSGVAGYAYLKRTRETQQEIFDRSALINRETQAFTDKIKDIETAEQLMEDRTLLKVALGAFGLDEDINNRAFIQRILESDLGDRGSLANKLADKRYLAFAQTFNFNGSDGPRLPSDRSASELSSRMAGLRSSTDLLEDRSLLRASLEQFGLEDNIQNTYFLEQILNSDLSDENSFANRMGNPQLVEFAKAFDFFEKTATGDAQQTPMDAVVATFAGVFDTVDTTDKLLQNNELMSEALAIFGFSDIYADDFLSDILNSDLSDPASFANSQSDERWAAFSAAFRYTTPLRDVNGDIVSDDLGEPVLQSGTLKTFVDVASADNTAFASADEFLNSADIRDATFDLLGIPTTFSSRNLARRGLESSPEQPNSFANLFPDPRFNALFNLVSIEPVDPERTYPEGFVEQVTKNYLERQFEIQVGESDPTMRIALSLERELNQVVQTTTSNDSRWFSIMSSPPLRKVFEGALRLPESFGSIDIDQQLLVFKDRAEQFFGTSEVSDFLDIKRMDELRQDYLLRSDTQSGATTSSANLASLILSSFA